MIFNSRNIFKEARAYRSLINGDDHLPIGLRFVGASNAEEIKGKIALFSQSKEKYFQNTTAR